MILWKDSLDFVVIVKEKKIDRDEQSLEDRVEEILREHPSAQNHGFWTFKGFFVFKMKQRKQISLFRSLSSAP